MEKIGLIAGSGRLPELFARGAKARGLEIHAVAHAGETDPRLSSQVDSWAEVRVGQLGRIAKLLRHRGVSRAVMAGGISRLKTFTDARPDWGCLAAAIKRARKEGA